MSTLTFEQQRLWKELDRYAHVWDEGEQAGATGLGPRDCPYLWAPGLNTPRLRWMEGLVISHERRIGSREFQPNLYRKAQQALKRDYRDASARSWSEVWATRLMRKVLP